MKVINKPINIMAPTIAKNTMFSSPLADQVSTKLSANIASVRNAQPSLNRHGNTFQGVFPNSTLTHPGTIRNSTAVQQTAVAKTPLYNPLNRHGNTFQGVFPRSTLTHPGTIRNSTAVQQTAVAKTPLYNPLNRHGNTFQGVFPRSTLTHPGTIRNSTAVQQTAVAKTPLYNPLNRHGNTFQGVFLTRPDAIFNAGSVIDKTFPTPGSDATLIKVVDFVHHQHVDEDSYDQDDEYDELFKSVPLFVDSPEDIDISTENSSDVILSDTEEHTIRNDPFKPLYYNLAFISQNELEGLKTLNVPFNSFYYVQNYMLPREAN